MVSDKGGDVQKCQGLIDVLIATHREGKEVKYELLKFLFFPLQKLPIPLHPPFLSF